MTWFTLTPSGPTFPGKPFLPILPWKKDKNDWWCWKIYTFAIPSLCIINIYHKSSMNIKDLFPVRWQIVAWAGKSSTAVAAHWTCRWIVLWRYIQVMLMVHVGRLREFSMTVMFLLHGQLFPGLRGGLSAFFIPAITPGQRCLRQTP